MLKGDDVTFTAVERIWRENHCLKSSSISVYKRWIHRFVAYCHARQLDERSYLTLAGVTQFARWYACAFTVNRQTVLACTRSAIKSWSLARQTLGETIPPWEEAPGPKHGRSTLLREFTEHLRLHRGNPEVTIRKKIAHMELLNAFLRKKQRNLRQLRLCDIDAFLVVCRERYARTTVADICSSLRSFVRFLKVSGRTRVDFSASILAPIVRHNERPHRALAWEDVQCLLRAIDRRSACGRRDYALLLMMSTYGFGAGEVIGLTLDDIDWRAQTLHVVRPKTGAEIFLPLLPPVARALASYLRYGRPKHAATRHVFVAMRTPNGQLTASSAVRHVLHKHARRAGITSPYLGAHVLRHTHACRQMELGVQPKVIGDILGHRDPDSTSAYLRVAIERLRDMALAVPA